MRNLTARPVSAVVATRAERAIEMRASQAEGTRETFEGIKPSIGFIRPQSAHQISNKQSAQVYVLEEPPRNRNNT